jgi:hypothetical protein
MGEYWMVNKKIILQQALGLSMKNNTGVYKKVFSIDPDQEEVFLHWLDARIKMARKPLGDSIVQIGCIPLTKDNGKDIPLDRPDDIAFSLYEYPARRDNCRKCFSNAQNRIGAQHIVAILINLGDAISKVLDSQLFDQSICNK